LWASGRRRDSRLAHFFYATVFWGVIVWLFVLPRFVAAPDEKNPDKQSVSSQYSSSTVATDTDDRAKLLSSPDRRAKLNEDAETPTLRLQTSGANDAPATSAESSNGSDDEVETPSLLSIDEVQQAVARAFVSGKPERWRGGKLRGYVVPSELLVAGCRTILVTNDKEPNSRVQTKFCG
jgi:cytoskeletal protein RodZ